MQERVGYRDSKQKRLGWVLPSQRVLAHRRGPGPEEPKAGTLRNKLRIWRTYLRKDPMEFTTIQQLDWTLTVLHDSVPFPGQFFLTETEMWRRMGNVHGLWTITYTWGRNLILWVSWAPLYIYYLPATTTLAVHILPVSYNYISCIVQSHPGWQAIKVLHLYNCTTDKYRAHLQVDKTPWYLCLLIFSAGNLSDLGERPRLPFWNGLKNHLFLDICSMSHPFIATFYFLAGCRM